MFGGWRPRTSTPGYSRSARDVGARIARPQFYQNRIITAGEQGFPLQRDGTSRTPSPTNFAIEKTYRRTVFAHGQVIAGDTVWGMGEGAKPPHIFSPSRIKKIWAICALKCGRGLGVGK